MSSITSKLLPLIQTEFRFCEVETSARGYFHRFADIFITLIFQFLVRKIDVLDICFDLSTLFSS